MSVSDIASFRKVANPFSYFIYRFVPVFAVSLFVAVTLDRLHEPSLLPVATIGIGHACQTSGRAVVRQWSSRSDPRRSPSIAMHVGVSVGVLGAALCGYFLRVHMEALIPEVEDLAPELWGAAATALLATFLVRATTNRTLDAAEVERRQRQVVGSELLTIARSEARAAEADPFLVEAVLFTESLQRPKWFRRLEWVKSRFFEAGTYGVMQMQSESYISDEESVRRAIRERLSGTLADEALDYARLRAILTDYNPSEVFVETAMSLYFQIRHRDG